ncbi:MAG: hypothetical protein RR426_05695 [Oscillospiraceae bacterium]
MYYLLPGILAFFFFYLYEIYTVTGKLLIFKPLFLLGSAQLLLATAAAIWSTIITVPPVPWRLLLCGSVALGFFGLLLYALFFAIPFSKTYLNTVDPAKKTVCRSGLYALCRHPGVLCFAGFYLFLWLALGGKLLFWQFLVYNALNLAYILLQDHWSFPKAFADYADYQQQTPFLIPNRESLRLCMDSF